VLKLGAPIELLRTYEQERKPVALSVVETSGELVRSTRYSKSGTHAEDYVRIVERRAGYVTGMGIRYGDGPGWVGTRLHDFEVDAEVGSGRERTRIYSLLDYSRFTLLVFGDAKAEIPAPGFVKVVRIGAGSAPYSDQLILVRPDGYIAGVAPLEPGEIRSLIAKLLCNP
jgi:hypothetical protein